jgi:hypothetical protein
VVEYAANSAAAVEERGAGSGGGHSPRIGHRDGLSAGIPRWQDLAGDTGCASWPAGRPTLVLSQAHGFVSVLVP